MYTLLTDTKLRKSTGKCRDQVVTISDSHGLNVRLSKSGGVTFSTAFAGKINPSNSAQEIIRRLLCYKQGNEGSNYAPGLQKVTICVDRSCLKECKMLKLSLSKPPMSIGRAIMPNPKDL